MKRIFKIFVEFNRADEHLHSLKKVKSSQNTRSSRTANEEQNENLADLIAKIGR